MRIKPAVPRITITNTIGEINSTRMSSSSPLSSFIFEFELGHS
jgi:hypothetical protein